MSKVIVEYHPETYKEFFDEPLKDFPDLAEVIREEFMRYKGLGELPSIFGRDAPYIQPHAALRAQLMHIHLKLPPERFPENLPQYDRTCRKSRDAALVYVQGELEENRSEERRVGKECREW